MVDTPRLSLPMLAPAQAQKHVTVNEALSRLDALTHLTLVSTSLTTPPAVAPEGALYAVPPGAVNAWAGQDGKLALAIGGGWVFVVPRRGWQGMVLDAGVPAIWDGSQWQMGALSLSPSGAGLALQAVETDVVITAGSSVTTALVIPPRAILFGVTGRVLEAITGGATSWSLGVAGDAGRFGTGLGVALNSWVNGPAAPIVYWAPTALLLTPQGGSFGAGRVRLVVHCVTLSLPALV